MKKTFLLFVTVLLFNTLTQAQSTVWNFDKSHSAITFTIDHMVISEAHGKFTDFTVNLKSDKTDFTDAQFNAIIQINSVNTDNQMRDDHLKKPDYFDAAKYTTMEFKGFALQKIEGNKYKAVGDLTIKGKTKKVELDVKFGGVIKDNWGKTRAGFKVNGMINRLDFGIGDSGVLESGGLTLGRDVTINASFEFIK